MAKINTCAHPVFRDGEWVDCGKIAELKERFIPLCATHARETRRLNELMEKQLEKRKSLLQKAQSRNLEPRKKINKVSDKQAERLAEYSAKRLVYLSTYKVCEARVENVCDGKAIEIHHRAGRIGEMLTDVTYFLAVCRGCHDFIHQHPLDALKRNLSVSRLATQSKTI